MTLWYTPGMEMVCVACGTQLKEVPFYTKGKGFAPSIPFCPNDDCERAGLLTVNFRSKDEKNRDEGVPKEAVPTPSGATPDSS